MGRGALNKPSDFLKKEPEDNRQGFYNGHRVTELDIEARFIPKNSRGYSQMKMDDKVYKYNVIPEDYARQTKRELPY